MTAVICACLAPGRWRIWKRAPSARSPPPPNGNGRAGLNPLGRLAIHEGTSNVNSTITVARREVIPHWASGEAAFQRFHHTDIPQMCAEEVWADRAMVSRWLAEVAFHRQREHVIVAPDGRLTTDGAWARERLARLSRKAA